MRTEREDQSRSSFFDLATQKIIAEGSSQDSLATLPDDLEGQVIDEKFRISKLLGSGGMGCVYLARHLLLDKEVALKTFKSGHLGDEAKLRFQREAKAIARINHRNIIQIFDFGTTDGLVPYYTMEFLIGQTLGDRIKEKGRLAISEALSIFSQVFSGLSAAHQKGIVHRDMKPDNIFLSKITDKSEESQVKIVDFGIAALVDSTAEAQKLTASGSIFGSPLYMSPEQSQGLPVTEKSDIYSCGCALFEALSGKPPYMGVNSFSTMLAHQNAPVPSLKQASGGLNFPLALEDLLYSMLAKDPQLRIKTIVDVEAALEKIEKIGQIERDFGASGEKSSRIDRNIGTERSVAAGSIDDHENVSISNNQNYLTISTVIFFVVASLVCFALFAFQARQGQVPSAKQVRPKSGGSEAVTILMPDSTSMPKEVNYPLITPAKLSRALAEVRKSGSFCASEVTLVDSDFREIAGCKFLEGISLTKCEIDNSSLARFSNSKLQRVNLNISNFNDIGARNLRDLKKLTIITAKEANISDVGIGHLAAVKNLESLNLSSNDFSDDDVSVLARCKNLNYLSLCGNGRITSEALKPLKSLHLGDLLIASTAFDDAGFVYLRAMNGLHRFDCSRTKISINGLREFCRGKEKLRIVNISGCVKISPDDVSALSAEFPLISFKYETGGELR
ncbi:MAG: protein kinase [Cyanobacteria bacterium REEB67]|nr:protein kinase [Cyanobacteria bacterium REEB67]